MLSNLANTNKFAFVIVFGLNRYLVKGMANVRMGEPFIIMKLEEAEVKAGTFSKLNQTPELTDMKVDVGKFSVYDIEP